MHRIGRNRKQQHNSESADLGSEKMAHSTNCSASTAPSTAATSLEEGKHGGNFGRQFDTMCDRSFRAPRPPARRQSGSSKYANSKNITDYKDSGTENCESKTKDNDELNDDRLIPCSTTEEEMSLSAPCSSVYCSEESITGLPLSVLTRDNVRAFLNDYYSDFLAIKDSPTGESLRVLGEKYFREDYQFIRPSGNPISREGLLMVLQHDFKIISYKLISIDSISFLAAGKAAVVVFSSEHIFEYKGIPAEDHCVMTCILELTGGEIKIVHEHRSSGTPIPKETRWKTES